MSTTTVQVPAKHKAIVYDNPGTLSLKTEEVATPEPGPGEVLIELTHSGICHSDLSVMLNGWKFLPAPTAAGQVGGHEGVGKIVKLGAGADIVGHKIGDRVGVKWLSAACGGCPACLAGHDGVCFNGKISGYYTPGTFQAYTLGPANYVTPIPDGLESAAAAPMLCGGVTAYAALKKSGAVPGNWVVIFGAGGGLGHIAVQLAGRGMGFRVIGVDHSSKESLVKSLGAEQFVAFDQVKSVTEAVMGLTGGLGAKAAICLTASQKTYDDVMDMLTFGGRAMVVGLPEGERVPIKGSDPQTMVAKELSILGVAVGNRKDAIECLDMAARGIVKMHYTVEKMDNLKSVFENMQQGKLQGRVVLDLTS